MTTTDPQPDRLTDTDLDAIQARADAATPAPWQVIDGNEGTGSPPAFEVVNDAYLNPPDDDDTPWIAVELHVGCQADAEFIAHSRADVDRLLAEVRRQRGDLVVLGADRDILDQQVSAHEGELGDLRAKLAAADAEVDDLRAEVRRLTAERDMHATARATDAMVESWQEAARLARQHATPPTTEETTDGD